MYSSSNNNKLVNPPILLVNFATNFRNEEFEPCYYLSKFSKWLQGPT